MSVPAIPLFGGIPAGPEVLLIVVVVILLFGANKIPKLARSTGQAMGEFQKGRQQIEEELEDMQEGSDETPSEPTQSPEPTPSSEPTTPSESTPDTSDESNS